MKEAEVSCNQTTSSNLFSDENTISEIVSLLPCECVGSGELW
jgi:hypothetical protein